MTLRLASLTMRGAQEVPAVARRSYGFVSVCTLAKGTAKVLVARGHRAVLWSFLMEMEDLVFYQIVAIVVATIIKSAYYALVGVFTS